MNGFFRGSKKEFIKEWVNIFGNIFRRLSIAILFVGAIKQKPQREGRHCWVETSWWAPNHNNGTKNKNTMRITRVKRHGDNQIFVKRNQNNKNGN